MSRLLTEDSEVVFEQSGETEDSTGNLSDIDHDANN